MDLPGLCRVVLSALCCLLQEVSACFVLFVAGSFSLLCVVCRRKFQLPVLSIPAGSNVSGHLCELLYTEWNCECLVYELSHLAKPDR